MWQIFVSAPVNIEALNPSDPQTVLYDDKDFELSCTASGSNIDKVMWYKDDQPLDDKYFWILELEPINGQYKFEQKQAFRSVIQRKPESKLWNSYFCKVPHPHIPRPTLFDVACYWCNNLF